MSSGRIVLSSALLIGIALSATVLREPLALAHLLSEALFLAALTLLLAERHVHRHDDGHHEHAHAGVPATTCHAYRYEHERMVHAHKHWPDLFHRHKHGPVI